MELGEQVTGFLQGVFISLFFVGIVLGALFAFSGTWPPFLSVAGDSMSPEVNGGDIVVSVGVDGPEDINTYRENVTSSFGKPGDTISYRPNGDGTRVLHRTMFFVEEGENWYSTANKDYLPGYIDSCDRLKQCPAPYDGYITKGDSNIKYDQVMGVSPIVKPEWVTSKSQWKVPYGGYFHNVTTVLFIVIGSLYISAGIALLFSNRIFSRGDE